MSAHPRSQSALSRWLRPSLLVAVLAVVVGQAAPVTAADTAFVRHGHLSPDMEPVDVYVTPLADPSQTVTLTETTYGDISDYLSVPTGDYAVATRPAGAVDTTTPILSGVVHVEAGKAYTLACVGTHHDLQLKTLEDSLTLPAPGHARARVIHAASSAPILNLSLVGGQELGNSVPFAATTDYVDIPAGAATVRAAAPEAAGHDLPVSLEDGSVYTILVLDAAGGGFRPTVITDASSSGGTGPVPQQAVAAGAGGTASTDTSWALGWLAMAGLMVLGGGALLVRNVALARATSLRGAKPADG